MNQRVSGEMNVHRVSHFWTRVELLAALPQVAGMRATFELFVRPVGSNAIDILKVSECLRAMGLDFVEARLKASLVERLLGFPQPHPPTRVTFELVLEIYCELASNDDLPNATTMISGLRCCDTTGTGKLPYDQLRRMLTTVGERLDEAEAATLLDALKDDGGNVNYEALLTSLFARDHKVDAKVQQSRLYLEALGRNATYMDMRKRDEFIVALRRLDREQSGFVTADRILTLLNNTGDRFTRAELFALTRDMTNAQKQIDYRRFLRLIMNE